MRSIKFSVLGISLCLFVCTSVSAWATPFASIPASAQSQQQRNNQLPPQPPNHPQQTMPDQMQPQQDLPESTTFTGTILKSGEEYVLKAQTGDIYKLDDSSKAQPFEGKPVKVTGKLDTEAKLIHVENIEALSA